MWFWTGARWQFISLASPWIAIMTTANVPVSHAPPKQVIHEAPVAVPEYLARIREHCD